MSTILLFLLIGSSGGFLGSAIGYSVSALLVKKHNAEQGQFLRKAGIICGILSLVSALGVIGILSALSVDDPARGTVVSMIVGSLTVALVYSGVIILRHKKMISSTT